MKKVYAKPVLIKLGNLEQFIKGTGGPTGYLDVYSYSSPCRYNPNPAHPNFIKATCGDTAIGSANTCGGDPDSNYFVASITGGCI